MCNVIASTKCAAISFILGAFLVACGDDSSTTPGIPGFGSESSCVDGSVCSSSAKKLTRSSDSHSSEYGADGLSSSSVGEIPQSYSEANVKPSGTYDCLRYKCTTTEYLNQEFLEAGKYGEILDERDGRVYKTVKIGEQVWMAQNLNYSDSVQTPSLLGKNWCYEDDPKKCEVMGRLYTWVAAVDSVHEICPPGWHLPDNTEWDELFTAVGGQSTAATIMKSSSGWNDDGNGSDSVGFSGLPAGQRSNFGGFGCDGVCAFFWSASEYSSYDAYYVELYYFLIEGASLETLGKNNAYSVRCLKD